LAKSGTTKIVQLGYNVTKIDIKDVEATASDMGAKQFLESARSAGELAEMLGGSSGKKVTLFVPNDAAFLEYRGHHQQENVSSPLVATKLASSYRYSEGLKFLKITKGSFSMSC